MTGIELLLILKAGSLSLSLYKFFENRKVQETKRKAENAIYGSLSNINGKLDEIIANPLRSAFSYLEMAKNSNGSNKDTYTQQAMFKLVEATQYMKPDCPDWQTAHKALAMCQYYNQDYLNAMRSLDRSLETIYANYPLPWDISENSNDFREIIETFNLIAEIWCKAVMSDSYLKTNFENFENNPNENRLKSLMKVFDENMYFSEPFLTSANSHLYYKAVFWPLSKNRYDDYPEFHFVEL